LKCGRGVDEDMFHKVLGGLSNKLFNRKLSINKGIYYYK